MPYIKQQDRPKLDAVIDWNGALPTDAGQLNYLITNLVSEYIDRLGGVRYGRIAEVTGVLENVKQELYRRVAAPYEDSKIAENGDVNYPR